MKRVLFKVSSPFTVLTALIISELYYKGFYKILLVDCFINPEFEHNVKTLSFCQEIYYINHSNKELTHVEKTVDSFLDKIGTVDEYFMNTFSDCYSIMIAHRLYGKAILHVFPEGGTTAGLVTIVNNSLKFGLCASDSDRRSFFLKYPIDFNMFDFTWIYDEKIDHEGMRAKRILIDVRRLLLDEGITIRKFNKLFMCEDFPDFDVCVIDECSIIEGQSRNLCD